MSARGIDRWWYRFQIEVGIRFQLCPSDAVNSSWRRHLFDPFGNFVLIGDILANPRTQLPKFGQGYVDDVSPPWERPPNEPNALRPRSIWKSRCLWISGGVRLLGFEIGLGLFYRLAFGDGAS